MFSITSDKSRKLVTARMSGFLTVEEVSAFSQAKDRKVYEMGLQSGEYLLLVQTCDAVIQSQEVVAKFIEIVSRSPVRARRIAVVRGSSLTRMQTERILAVRKDAAIFADDEEGLQWLLSSGDTVQASCT